MQQVFYAHAANGKLLNAANCCRLLQTATRFCGRTMNIENCHCKKMLRIILAFADAHCIWKCQLFSHVKMNITF